MSVVVKALREYSLEDGNFKKFLLNKVLSTVSFPQRLPSQTISLNFPLLLEKFDGKKTVYL